MHNNLYIKSCPRCKQWTCKCEIKDKNIDIELKNEIQEQVKLCVSQLQYISAEAAEGIAKSVFTLCFDDSVTKEIIGGYVAKCLLESGLPTAPQITEQINNAIAVIDIPGTEDIKDILLECQRTEEAIRILILQELSNQPNQEVIEIWSKTIAVNCFQELIKDYCTKEEINALISIAFESLNDYSEHEIRDFASEESKKCIEAYPFSDLILQALENSGFQTIQQIRDISKEEAQSCISALEIPTKELVEAWSKAVALACYQQLTQDLYQPTQEELAEFIKATTFDCLKDLIGHDSVPDGNTRVSGVGLTCDSTGLVRFQVLQSDNTVEQVEANFSKFFDSSQNLITSFTGICDSNNILHLSLGQSEGVDFDLPINLSKLVSEVDSGPDLSFCFDYGGQVFRPDTDGKVTFTDHLKCELWTGGFEHVTYDPQAQCRVIKWKGPTQADIQNIATEVFQDLNGGSSDLTLNDVKDCIQSVNNTLCITDLSVGINSNTGEVTVSISDQCGTKSDSFFVPMDPTGNNGITQEVAKTIAQNCINQTVKGIVLQCIADEVSVPSESEINQIVQTYIQNNLTQFCNSSLGLNFDPVTRQLTVTVTDQCGPKSDTVFIPGVDVNSGVTKADVQACIDDPSNNARFCNSNVDIALVGTQLQFSVTDDCGTQSANQDLSSLQQSYCITGTSVQQVGQIVTVTQLQENCPDPIQFSFTAGAGSGSVECCNTSNTLQASLNQVNKTIDFVSTIMQSVGAPVSASASIPIADLANLILDIETATDTDGCSRYQQMKLCGVDFGERIPVYEPKQRVCKKFCPDNLTGELTISTEHEIEVQWEEGQSEVIPAGGTSIYNYNEPYSDAIRICFTNVCLSDDETLYASLTMTPQLPVCC